jgi:hypothetical protein
MRASPDTRQGLLPPAPQQMSRRGAEGDSSDSNLTELLEVRVLLATLRGADTSRLPETGLRAALTCDNASNMLLNSAFRASFAPVGWRRKTLVSRASAPRPTGRTGALTFRGRPGPRLVSAQTTALIRMSSGEMPLSGERSEMR